MSVCDRTANRKGAFKKTMSTEDCRRKREDKMISVRKSKREEKLRKRRNMKASKGSGSLNGSTNVSTTQGGTAVKNSGPLLDLATLSKCRFLFLDLSRSIITLTAFRDRYSI
jgi:hypothetical protein